MARSVIAVVATILVAGCDGGEQREQLFTLADAARIASVRPAMQGWTWPQSPEKHVSSGPPTDPLDVELRRQTADLRSLGDKANKCKDEEIDGLGDEAWILKTESSGTEVTYHWRRGNLVLEAHVQCFAGCPTDIEAATRDWVDAIDEAARADS